MVNAVLSFLGIKSPSQVFSEIGMYSMQGLAGGLKKYSGLVETEATNVGDTAVNSLSKAVSKISDVISGDMDMTPTIRPVLDMTDVEKGLTSTFDKKQGINVSTIESKTANISGAIESRKSDSDSNTSQTTNNKDESSLTIHNHYTVRSDSDIQKISQKLKNTLERYNNAKGVLVEW
jgi:hypothetical protein